MVGEDVIEDFKAPHQFIRGFQRAGAGADRLWYRPSSSRAVLINAAIPLFVGFSVCSPNFSG